MTAPAPATPPGSAPTVAISIARQGELFLNGSLIKDAELEGELRRIAAKDRGARLVLQADKAAAYARVLFVIDTAKRAGLTRISIGTDPTPGPPPSPPSPAPAPGTAPRRTTPTPTAPPPSAPAPASASEIVISITKQGEILLGGARIGDAELERVLRRIAAKDKDAGIVLQADKAAAHARVVFVMDTAKRAGIARISISGMPAPPQPTKPPGPAPTPSTPPGPSKS